ncbi:MFS transporter [Halobellus ruber]|uniref:MFS transporter n=1 Tax=Halobellus ruber TaxID=2761102 RepID=A0A7J9SH12_9EURY|nr:MFS transporter [Halobellus ruber]MBB6646230.1 MFS transporter [Halobellus ruber]
MNGEPDSELDSLTSRLVVAFGVVVLLLVWGVIFTFTVYSEALSTAFGLSELRTSTVFSITTAAFYVAGGVAGVLAARVPLRPVVAAAGGTIAASVGLLQITTSYPGVVAAFGLLGTAGGTIFVVVISLVPQWFDEYEGRAMGITFTGNGLGILVLPPAWVWLLERTGIRGAFAVIGGATALAVLAAATIYRRPTGRQSGGELAVGTEWIRRNVLDPRFLAAVAGFSLLWTWYFVLSADLVGILTGNGIPRGVAATAFGVVGGVSVVGRLASGEFADRIGMRVTLTGGVVVAGLSLAVLPWIAATLPMYALLVAFGAGLGAVAPLFSPIVIGRFGPGNATAVVGAFTVGQAVTSFSAPVVLSLLRSASGGYTAPLVFLGGATLLGGVLFYRGTAPAADA